MHHIVASVNHLPRKSCPRLVQVILTQVDELMAQLHNFFHPIELRNRSLDIRFSSEISKLKTGPGATSLSSLRGTMSMGAPSQPPYSSGWASTLGAAVCSKKETSM